MDQKALDIPNKKIVIRPGVDGAVLQAPLSLINSVSEPFPPNLQNIINHKP